jgi:3-phosphoshikimate 1-carboxyvinyltransferase
VIQIRWQGTDAVVSPRQSSHGLSFDYRPPSDKSLTHRALMFSSLAVGTSRIYEALWGADCQSTYGVFRDLGVKVQRDATQITVESTGMAGFSSPENPLDFGNSGTTARLLLGVLSSVPDLFVTAFGDHSLSSRPMGRVVEPLRKLGAEIMGRSDGKFLPIAIRGKALRSPAGGAHFVVDKASAQVKSAILLAGALAKVPMTIELPAGSRDHTERLLTSMGAVVKTETVGGLEKIALNPTGFSPKSGNFRVPADPSSSAFFVCWSALFPGGKVAVTDLLTNPTRTGYIEVLKRMGMQCSWDNVRRSDFMEEVGTLRCQFDDVPMGGEISPAEVPTLVDEVPILAVVAAFAKGPSHFRDLAELRVKESDRLAKTAELLKLAGAKFEVIGDDLKIAGGLKTANSFTYDSALDHRLAMAATIMATRAETACTIKGADSVAVSFPGFFEHVANEVGSAC